MPFRMRVLSSSSDAIRMCRRKLRAILEKADSMRFSHELGRVDVLEAARAAGQVSQGLFGDVGAVVVENDVDDRLTRIVFVQAAQQCDELNTAMVSLHVGEDLTGCKTETLSWSRLNRRKGHDDYRLR
jgi:hypothetical protein